jgi:hypothetical protein
MTKARVTLPTLYPEGSLGHKDLAARNGHYFEAQTEYELNKQIERFAIRERKPVDVQEWPSCEYKMRVVPTLAAGRG